MAQRLRAVLRALQPERAAPAAAVDGAGAGAGAAAAAGSPKPLTDGQLKDWVANGMAVITIPEEELPASVHSDFYRKAKAMADGEVRRSHLRATARFHLDGAHPAAAHLAAGAGLGVDGAVRGDEPGAALAELPRLPRVRARRRHDGRVL